MYPVIILLHGSGGDESDWDIAYPSLDSLIERGDVAPVIAVAPASETSWWVDGVEPFEQAMFSDLIPALRRRFAIRDDRRAWVVAGFSMGGYGALRYALAHPETFGGAIALSPAVYAKQPPNGSSARSSGVFGKPFDPALWASLNYPAVLSSYLAKQLPVHVFLAAGDDEWNHPEGPEFNVEVQVAHLYNLLNKQHGISAELRIADGSHDWALWLPLFEQGLKGMAAELEHFRKADP